MRYILNSAVITDFGLWKYEPITLEEAREWLLNGEWVSTVRYGETAEVIKCLTGVEVPVRNMVVTMEPGDEALVFRLKFEKGAQRVSPELKGNLPPEFVQKYLEIGILRRL
ncbi:MAG: STIV orfB116 family protein [bacterium JZ-2024 1]